jgi:hypothetical protein
MAGWSLMKLRSHKSVSKAGKRASSGLVVIVEHGPCAGQLDRFPGMVSGDYLELSP